MRKYVPTRPYRAKIQVRPLDEKVVSFVKRTLKSEGANITEIFELKEGADILVDSSNAAFSLAKKFKKQFNGETKVTSSLVGEDKQAGKRIHILTVLLRLKKE